MKVEIKVPAVGESITEATIASWLKKDGDQVTKNEVLLSLETDKATVEVVAEQSGKLSITSPAGSIEKIGAVIGGIDTDAAGASAGSAIATVEVATSSPTKANVNEVLSPAVRRVVEERGISPASIAGTGKDGRITKFDAESAPNSTATVAVSRAPSPGVASTANAAGDVVRRVPMTTIRKRIAQRLVEAQHTAAILTTFNEVDMTAVMQAREKYKDKFKEKYGVGLGFMGFFVKATIEALKAYPAVNASIEDDEMVFKEYYHIGVAVGTERGLVVPVIRNADRLSLAGIELAIKEYGAKGKEGKISPNDMSGGSFTISNGGVYGSLMSTPILNPPQSGILGMHKIQDRAMVIDKKIEIRPMMYLALSYDHRIIDGKEAVSFLVRIKECLEDPQRMLLEI